MYGNKKKELPTKKEAEDQWAAEYEALREQKELLARFKQSRGYGRD